ncbi:MAG TPA: NUMOD4 domain-containing protein, partial [Methanosarcina sp.]|nr:NUMOD4 domain-containing protein [Methanosarcina sp.]
DTVCIVRGILCSSDGPMECQSYLDGYSCGLEAGSCNFQKRKEAEIWMPLRFTESYEASNLGRVRSVNRVEVNCSGVSRNLSGKMLKPIITGKYGAYVNINKKLNGLPKIIFGAFVEGDLPKRIIHKDGNFMNNSIDNLIEWRGYANVQHKGDSTK